jgi:hypothetical protein
MGRGEPAVSHWGSGWGEEGVTAALRHQLHIMPARNLVLDGLALHYHTLQPIPTSPNHPHLPIMGAHQHKGADHASARQHSQTCRPFPGQPSL